MNKAIGILGAAAGAYLLSTRGRTGQPGLEKFRGWAYAHRGLHGEGRPENSLAAFRAAVEGGYGAELDVHLLKDGSLAVIHDSKLLRTTGKEGRVEDLTAEELAGYTLEGTEETIPLFSDVLKVFAGKTPLIVELKVENNCDALCSAVAELLEGYEGDYCVESFDPRAVAWFKKNRPQVIRGQLMENYFATGSKLYPALKLALTNHMANFLTGADFVACRYQDLGLYANAVARSLWKMAGVTWTIRTQAEFDDAVSKGWIPIFEGFAP